VNGLLLDTGPIVALLDRDDGAHARCVEAARRERARLVSTWAVVTEAMYLLHDSTAAQSELLGWLEKGHVRIAELHDLLPRIRKLLEKYADLPVDFADATLVAVAERDGIDRVFTLDGDFTIYRIGGRRRFRIVP
jgi:uncharacterized protein